MLDLSDATDKFIQPVSGYLNVGRLQKALLKNAADTGETFLAAVRCLALLFDTDLAALISGSIEPVSVKQVAEADLPKLAAVHTLVQRMRALFLNVSMAIDEAIDYLPQHTIAVLREYNTAGSPVDRVAVAVLLIMAANLQE